MIHPGVGSNAVAGGARAAVADRNIFPSSLALTLTASEASWISSFERARLLCWVEVSFAADSSRLRLQVSTVL
jgi:hypothetical protein